MVKFLSKDFLLNSKTAKKLYHGFAKDCPIIDYHCHVSPEEIYKNKRFSNITEVWLKHDHYKWRIMRSNGVDEKFITGDASDFEKFLEFSKALPRCIGNPMYHWCHLELKNYFGFKGVLNESTAKEVFELSKKVLAKDDMGARGIINKSGVSFIGTTDDPIDSLEWHKKLAEDKDFKVTVAPSFRPDKALNVDKDGWAEYIEKLSAVSGIEIKDLNSLKQALANRIEYFYANGCKASDHGLDQAVYVKKSEEELNLIMQKGFKKQAVSILEGDALRTELLLFCANEYYKRGMVMQIHYNCLRNPNKKMLEKIGVDTGFDCMGPNSSNPLSEFLNELNYEESLPKTILYSLDPSDNEFLDVLIGAFQGTEARGKIQHGSAWWFNDNKQGMQDQLTSLANLSILGNFVGMLTDSRSFLSYARHEYFRRILCNFVGSLIENGEYPNDINYAGGLIKDICFNNAKNYFDLEEK